MSTPVTMVRIYGTEGDHKLEELLKLLHDQEQVRGVTAYRGIAGFGRSGRYHLASLLDLATNLPVVIEFFDTPEKIEQTLQHLEGIVEPGHMVAWHATLNQDP